MNEDDVDALIAANPSAPHPTTRKAITMATSHATTTLDVHVSVNLVYPGALRILQERASFDDESSEVDISKWAQGDSLLHVIAILEDHPDSISALTRAGALIAGEIDLLQGRGITDPFPPGGER